MSFGPDVGLGLAVLAGLVTDAGLGEPRTGHPLIWFGRAAERIEQALNDDTVAGGAKALAVLVLPILMLVGGLVASLPGLLAWVVVAGLIYLAVGRHSLARHARPVEAALAVDDIDGARRRVAALVSRDTESMDMTAIRRAAIESVLENTSDAVVASLVWAALGAVLFGATGAALAVITHRLVNTLDAMWGYRTPRYLRFGRVAARLDDGLNWLPARLTAGAFVLLGNRRDAWRCWQSQAVGCDSPNAGPVMTAGAGALGITLGGGARYHGAWRERAVLGCGGPPGAGAIERALGLMDRAVAAIVAVVLAWALL